MTSGEKTSVTPAAFADAPPPGIAENRVKFDLPATHQRTRSESEYARRVEAAWQNRVCKVQLTVHKTHKLRRPTL